MSARDEEIGRAVVALRGDRSQQALANAMRERGWKWSQATVWSIETGERPLRLAEAEDLASVLGLGVFGISDLLRDEPAVQIESVSRATQASYDAIAVATHEFLQHREDLFVALAGALGRGYQPGGVTALRCKRWLTNEMTAETAVQRGYEMMAQSSPPKQDTREVVEYLKSGHPDLLADIYSMSGLKEYYSEIDAGDAAYSAGDSLGDVPLLRGRESPRSDRSAPKGTV